MLFSSFCLIWVYFAIFFPGCFRYSLDCWYDPFSLFCCVGLYYKFLSQQSFSCLPQFLMLYFHFYSVQYVFWFQLRLHFLLGCLLSSFQVFGDFPVVFLLLISNYISLWFENMIYILLNLLMFVLLPRIWSILTNLPLEKNAVVEWSVL